MLNVSLLAPLRRLLLVHPPAILLIDLVAEHDEREAIRVPRSGLDEELVLPAPKLGERLTAARSQRAFVGVRGRRRKGGGTGTCEKR